MDGQRKLCSSVWVHTQTPFSFHIQSQLQFSLGYLAKHWPLALTVRPVFLSSRHVSPLFSLLLTDCYSPRLTPLARCQLNCTSPSRLQRGGRFFPFFFPSSLHCWESPVPTFIMSHQLRRQAAPQTLEGIICQLVGTWGANCKTKHDWLDAVKVKEHTQMPHAEEQQHRQHSFRDEHWNTLEIQSKESSKWHDNDTQKPTDCMSDAGSWEHKIFEQRTLGTKNLGT